MRGDRLSALLPFGALLIPWIAGHYARHHHALLLAVLSLALAIAATLRKPGVRAEDLVLPVVLALSWPYTLITVMHAAIGVDRLGLITCASIALLAALLVRVLSIRRSLPAGRRDTITVLGRSFPECAAVVRAELGLLWFGLFRWRHNAADTPPDAIRFPGTATGTEMALCLLTAAGFVIETPLLHLLLAHVSGEIVAWGCTGLHVILGVYLIGYAKSLLFRPTLLFPDRLEIRLGVLAQRVIPRGSIEAIVACHGQKTADVGEQRLFALDEPNLRLSTAGTHILFRVDEPGRLASALLK